MDQLPENKNKVNLKEKPSMLTLSTMQIINAEKQKNHIKNWKQMFKSNTNQNYEILEAITFLIFVIHSFVMWDWDWLYYYYYYYYYYYFTRTLLTPLNPMHKML